MDTRTSPRSALIVGRSQLVLDEAVAGLRDLGYRAEGTNDFTSGLAGRIDVREVDVVVFGGQVPPDRKADLRDEIAAVNPRVIVVQGLAGIPGLIVNQVRGAFAADQRDPGHAPTHSPDGRSIRLRLAEPADVTVTLWWTTSFVPPDPKSDSRVVVDERLPAGDHVVRVPADIPQKAAFATVQVDPAVYAFSITTA
jgi:hypothetical protein